MDQLQKETIMRRIFAQDRTKRNLAPRLLVATLAAAAGLQSGCVSMSSMQTGEVVKTGSAQQTFGGGYYTSPDLLGTKDAKDLQIPTLEYSYREGIMDKVDVGLKLTPTNYVLDGRYQVVQGDAFDMSVGGALGYGSYTISLNTGSGSSSETRATIVDLMIPATASYTANEWFTAYLSPRLVYRITSGSSSTGTATLAGATVGAKFGQDWGAYVEAATLREIGQSFNANQVNVAFFWSQDGFLKQFGLLQ